MKLSLTMLLVAGTGADYYMYAVDLVVDVHSNATENGAGVTDDGSPRRSWRGTGSYWHFSHLPLSAHNEE